MEKRAREYISSVRDYDTARNCLSFLMIFSLANILIYYLTSIRWIDTVLEFLGWNGYLAPAASLPRTLFVRYVDAGQWLTGVLLTALSLLPYLLSWLLSGNPGSKLKKFRGWTFWPAIIWYAADTLLHLHGAVLCLISAFSLGGSFWEVIGIILRVCVFLALIGGICAPKQIRKTWENLEAQMLVGYILRYGPEAAKQLPKEELTKMTVQYCNQVQKAVNKEALESI
jgi:hypothetical protein